jgi:hypothetical protein
LYKNWRFLGHRPRQPQNQALLGCVPSGVCHAEKEKKRKKTAIKKISEKSGIGFFVWALLLSIVL